jgi:hypothetical protein
VGGLKQKFCEANGKSLLLLKTKKAGQSNCLLIANSKGEISSIKIPSILENNEK